MRKYSIFLKILSLSVCFFVLLSGCAKSTPANGGSNEHNSKENTVTIGNNEYFIANGLKITYKGWQFFDSYTRYSAPGNGHKVIQLDLTAENIDSDSRYISFYDFTCTADGKATPRYLSSKDKIDGSLSPGDSLDGSVLFEIPIDAKKIYIEYTADFWDEGNAVIEINLNENLYSGTPK